MIFFYLLVSIMPLVNHPLWSRFVGALTLTKFVGVACLLYAVWYCLRRRTLPRFLHSWVVRLFLLFYALAALSYLWKGTVRSWYVNPLISYTSFLLLLFITCAVVDSSSRLRITFLVAIGSLAFASLYVIREWQVYHHLYAGYRPGYITGDPNYFTLSAVVCLPLAYYLILHGQAWWNRAFCLGCLLVTFVAVTLAASRGGFLGLLAVVVIIVWRSPQRLRNLSVIAVLAVPLLLFAPSSPLQRLLHPDYGDQAGEDTRLELWRAGWQMIEQHPLTGVGVGNFKLLVTGYEDPDESLRKIAHNTYIEIAAEMGIPSLLVFVGILFFAFCSLQRVRREDRVSPFLRTAAAAMQAGLLGCTVSIMFISCEQQKLLWFLLFLTPCVESLAEVPTAEDAAEEPLMAEAGEAGETREIEAEEWEFT